MNLIKIRRLFKTIVLSCAVLCSGYAANAAQSLDKVVAIVNDEVITQSQLNTMMDDLQHIQAPAQNAPAGANDLRQKALDLLIDQKMQLQIAARNKITITDAELNQAIDRIASQNHLTAAEFTEALGKNGINYHKFRQQVHDQLLIHKVQMSVFAGKITVSDADALAYMKKMRNTDDKRQYQVDDLLVPLTENPTPSEVTAAQQTAKALLAQAKSGKSFADLAGQNTQLQQTNLGLRTLADIPSIFATEVSNLKVGQVAGPITAPNGIHLIQLVSIQGQSGSMSLLDAKNAVFQDKLKTQVDIWLQQVRRSAYVKIVAT